MAKRRPKNERPKVAGKRITRRFVESTEGLPPPPPAVPPVEPHPEPDDDPWGRDGLTLKQRRFCEAYVGDAAGNATRAAEIAGYRADNRVSLAWTASENLRKPHVQRYLARLMTRAGGGRNWARAGIVEIARSNMADFVAVDADGKAKIDLARAHAAAAMGAIKKIRVKSLEEGGQEITLETYDRLAALQSLMRMHGAIVERVEHSGPGGGAVEHRHAFDHESFARQFADYARSRLRDGGDRTAAGNGH